MFKTTDYGPEAKAIGDATKAYFQNLGWSEEDVTIGCNLTMTIHLMFMFDGLPIKDPKFQDVLGAVRHTLELAIFLTSMKNASNSSNMVN